MRVDIYSKDLYDYKKIIETTIKRIDRDTEVSKRNKKLIFDFKEDLESDGLSAPRVLFYLIRLDMLAKYLKKDFDKATRKDIKRLVGFINTKPDYSAETKHDYKVAIRRFYVWLGKKDFFIDKQSGEPWFKVSIKKKDRKLPEEILTKQEVRKLIEATTNSRDKALISVLYESGARIGEVMGLKIKDLSWEKYLVRITVTGKTGSRKIPLVESLGYIKAWLDNHPDHNNPDAWLWANISNNKRGERLKYRTVRELLIRTSKRAGIKKAVNPHAFRHARATHLAKELTEAQLCQFFGWKFGSQIPAIYTHLSGRDLDNSILSLYGIAEAKEEEQDVIVCPRCRARNNPGAQFCAECGMPLSLEVVMKQEEEHKVADKEMANFLKLLLGHKEILESLKKIVKEEGI